MRTTKCMYPKLFMATVGATFIISGCATTVDYSESITRIEKAIHDSATSIKVIDTNITAKKNAKLKNDIIAKKLILSEVGCALGKKECTLIVDGNHCSYCPINYPIKTAIPKGMEALERVKIYVSGLKAIIEADTVAKVTASANVTLGSIEKLARKDGQSDSETNKITECREPIVGLIGWISSKYVERIKTKALAKATRDAHNYITGLTSLYGLVGQIQAQVYLPKPHSIFLRKKDHFNALEAVGAITASSVDAYVLAAAAYDAKLKISVANPFRAFESAHEKLMMQLNGKDKKNITLVDVAVAIEDLEQEVTKIKALAEGFKKKSNDANNGDSP